ALPHDTEVRPEDLRRLLETKRKYLRALADDDNSYFDALVAIDSQQRELLRKGDSFRDFIDERALWVRSTHALAPADIGRSVGAVAWLVNPNNWWSAVKELAAGIAGHAMLSFLIALAFIPWVLSQRRLREIIKRLGRWSTGENQAPAPHS